MFVNALLNKPNLLLSSRCSQNSQLMRSPPCSLKLMACRGGAAAFQIQWPRASTTQTEIGFFQKHTRSSLLKIAIVSWIALI